MDVSGCSYRILKTYRLRVKTIDLFTDTAAILNNLVLLNIMGCPGGKN